MDHQRRPHVNRNFKKIKAWRIHSVTGQNRSQSVKKVRRGPGCVKTKLKMSWLRFRRHWPVLTAPKRIRGPPRDQYRTHDPLISAPTPLHASSQHLVVISFHWSQQGLDFLLWKASSAIYNARPNDLQFEKHSLGKSRAKEANPNSQRTFAAVCKAYLTFKAYNEHDFHSTFAKLWFII